MHRSIDIYKKCLIASLLLVIVSCSGWENDIIFSNFSNVDIYSLVLKSDGHEYDFGAVNYGYSQTSLIKSFDLSSGVVLHWTDFDGKEFGVSINGDFFSVKNEGTYRFVLVDDGLKLNVEKYNGEQLIEKVAIEVKKVNKD
ncbi:hypothetical protein [Pleionea sediminis]|uniref:hypothetical protein n=1 Tax=Pleionea sediminis TaxID=2569479 RepID=UPI0011846C9C|nr:hypothetical protein [Pleionea sediminis]